MIQKISWREQAVNASSQHEESATRFRSRSETKAAERKKRVGKVVSKAPRRTDLEVLEVQARMSSSSERSGGSGMKEHQEVRDGVLGIEEPRHVKVHRNVQEGVVEKPR